MNSSTEPVRASFPVKFVVGCCILLAAVTLGIYYQTHTFNYVTYDDGDYVYDNVHVNHGLSMAGIAWAFSALYLNWHPLTWLSLMLDVELFGLNAGRAHLVNVAFHIASSICLFIALTMMTRKAVRSAFVAGVFAVHPLHVESVAWIAERKDVLSTFFEMLTLLAYAFYLRKKDWLRYSMVTLAFACAVMSKPMAVTFPFILLLLDYWPLQRFDLRFSRARIAPLLREKAILFGMSIGASVLTVLAQRNSGAVMSLTSVPMRDRIANAVVATTLYITKTFWPARLSVFYPLNDTRFSAAILSALAIAGITAGVLYMAGTRRYLIVGWLWYIAMLLPVIGIVQVGLQSMADRYTYVPMVGLSIALVWFIAECLQGRFVAQAAVGVLGIAALAALAILSHQQVSYWSDSETLYNHAVAVTSNNYVAENNLGTSMALEGRHFEAMTHYRNAIRMRPAYAPARSNLAAELIDNGRPNDAFTQLTESLRLEPDQPVAEANLGAVYKMRGNLGEAERLLRHSISRKPDNAFAQSDLCAVLTATNKIDEALAHCRQAVELNPKLAEARYNLAVALKTNGDKQSAR